MEYGCVGCRLLANCSVLLEHKSRFLIFCKKKIFKYLNIYIKGEKNATICREKEQEGMSYL